MKYFIRVLLSALLFTGSLSAATLHVILVGDTLAWDLRSSILLDIKGLESHVREVAKYTGMDLSIHRLLDEDCCSQKTIDALAALQCGKNDTVFFYFSGHGYRTPLKEGNPWPNLYFSGDQEGIDLAKIGQSLRQKPARLTLVFADCCNSSLPDHVAPPVHKGRPSAFPNERVEKNFKKLFIESSGQVMAASSKAGQPSWGFSSSGSLYTGEYMRAFKLFVKCTHTDVLDWQLVLDQVSYNVYKVASPYGIVQDPIYEIKKEA